MKRLSLGLAVAALTFFIGVAADLVRLTREPAGIPAPVESEALPVEYFELQFDPDRYVGRQVRLRVKIMIDWAGSLDKWWMGDPRSPWEETFFGYEYAPDSEESLAGAKDFFGVDPRDPAGEINVFRLGHATLEGEFVIDRDKTDWMGRTYPYWFIVHRLEGVDARW